jgi:hypothetical protein
MAVARFASPKPRGNYWYVQMFAGIKMSDTGDIHRDLTSECFCIVVSQDAVCLAVEEMQCKCFRPIKAFAIDHLVEVGTNPRERIEGVLSQETKNEKVERDQLISSIGVR